MSLGPLHVGWTPSMQCWWWLGGGCVSGAPACRLDLFHVVLVVVGGDVCLGPLPVGWTPSM